jgi:hypothetical protein
VVQGATAASTADVLALAAAGIAAPPPSSTSSRLRGLDRRRARGDRRPSPHDGRPPAADVGVPAGDHRLGLPLDGVEVLLPKARAALAALQGKSPAVLGNKATANELAQTVLPAVGSIARAIVALGRAATTMEVEAATSLDYKCSLPNVRRLATSFKAAAASNLAYLDALIVADLAKALGQTMEQAKDTFALREPGYLVAMMGANVTTMDGLPAQLKAAWGEDSIAWGLFALAASELSFGDTSELISEYYSLQLEFGPDGDFSGVAHDAAFDHMLEFAERRTREQARAALVATGAIPVQTQLYYQIAETQRTGDLRERLDALGSYWTAMQFAQTAVMLARN